MSDTTSTAFEVCEQEDSFDEAQFMAEMHSGIVRAVQSTRRRFVVPMLLCLMFVWLFLPIIKAGTLGTSETANFTMRGYEMFSYGPNGIKFLLTPWLLAAVIYSSLSDNVKTLLLLLLFPTHILSAVDAFNAATGWFDVVGAHTSYTPFFLLYSILFVLECVAAYLVTNTFRAKPESLTA